MRFEEFDTKYPVIYTPGDVESMRSALKKYIELIVSKVAFEDSYCVAHFVHACDRLPISYFDDYPEILQIVKSEVSYGRDLDEEEKLDIQSMMTGETLFFACAMMHPELELDVKMACEAIVKFARDINDSSEMWITCEEPFGITPLYITAKIYPKYGYLLASFLIPYWDDEHMPESLFRLCQWSDSLGITEDTLKAFCYCDNSRAREGMLGYDNWDGGSEEPIDSSFDLLNYFREDQNAYENFMDLLAKRYEDMPYLQTYDDDEDDYDENPIKSLVLEMLYVHSPYEVWDDDFDIDEYLTQTFVNSPADEAIVYIKEAIESKLNRAIVPSFEVYSSERKAVLSSYCDDNGLDEDYDELDGNDKLDWDQELTSIPREIDDMFVDSDEEAEFLNKMYSLISEHREESHEILSSWFSLNQEILDDDCSFDDKIVSPRGYCFIGMYILYRDNKLDLSDNITELARNFVSNFTLDFVMQCMTSEGKWPEYSRVSWAQNNTFDNEYQKKCQREILAEYELWKPMENYLKTGIFKDYTYENSFTYASKYFKENLDVEESSIGDLQPNYEWFCSSNNENRMLVKMAFWSTQIDNFNYSDLLSRVLKICFNIAPLRVVNYLEDVILELCEPRNIEDFIKALDLLKNLGLPESAYWIYQLNSLGKIIDCENVELVNEIEDIEYIRHYLRLMKLYFDDIRVKKADVDVKDLMISELKNIQKSIRIGGNLIPRSDLLNILLSADKALGSSLFHTHKLNDMAINKIKRALAGGFYHLSVYIENTLRASDVDIREVKVNFFDMDNDESIKLLEFYGGHMISESKVKEISRSFELSCWNRIILNKNQYGYESIYNGDVINYCYTQLKLAKDMALSGFDLKIVENLSAENVDSFNKLSEVDYKSFWMSCIEKYINHEVPFDYVKDLIKCGVSTYDFLTMDGYYDMDLSCALMDISPGVRNRIVNIIGAVDPSKLDLVDDEDMDYYLNFLLDANVDRNVILDYLIYMEEDEFIEELALKTDITPFIKALNIENQIEVLSLVAKYAPYHPLLLELKNHKSLKVKNCVKGLIKLYNIQSENIIKYHIVDYGIYKMGEGVSDSNQVGVSKTANEPVCIDNTDDIVVKNNMYIGLRFTAEKSLNLPKVCVHSVVVTHPIRDEYGDLIITNTSWNQNGYSESNIFLGWFFDENEELLAGKYEFKALDIDGNIMVEHSFNVRV